MKERLYFLLPLLLTSVLASKSSIVAASQVPGHAIPSHTQNNPSPGARTRADLSGGIENDNGQLRLNLTNDSSREFLGEGIIGIGDALEKREIGQLTIQLAPQETKLWRINGVYPSGPQFSLKVFDRLGALAFYKIAPIKPVTDTTPAIAVTLRPIPSQKENSALLSNDSVSAANPVTDPQPTIADVTIKGRLLADQMEADRFIIAFELLAARSLNGSTLAITLGEFKDRKSVSANQTQTIEFKLPDHFGSERIEYELTSKSGSMIAKGALDIGRLMAEDSVTVTDIRTDRASYEPGDRVQITVLLDGAASNGIRLEMKVRDGQGGVIAQDQYRSGENYQTNSQSFNVTLPREIASPVTFEFKIYDSATGRLFDSGERIISIGPTGPIRKTRRRQ